MYRVELHGSMLFGDVAQARIVASALELIAAGADVRTGGPIIKNELGSLIALRQPAVDRSKHVVGGQAAREQLDRIVSAITAGAYRQLPDELFDAAYAHAAATGQVDLSLVLSLVQQELYPERTEAVEFLDSAVSRAAAEQASREFKRATAVKKQRG